MGVDDKQLDQAIDVSEFMPFLEEKKKIVMMHLPRLANLAFFCYQCYM